MRRQVAIPCLVMGTSFYQVGFYRNFWGYRSRTGEVEALTQAQLAARELAVSRLQQEAALWVPTG